MTQLPAYGISGENYTIFPFLCLPLSFLQMPIEAVLYIYRDSDVCEAVVGKLEVDVGEGVKCRGQSTGSSCLQVEPRGDHVWNLVL